jgi:acetyl-CoA carboxylase biotin carboxyl carrier protein
MRMDEIRKLIELLDESDLTEIEVARWWGWGRVRLSKSSTNHAAAGPAHGNGAGSAAPAAEKAAESPAANPAPATPVAPPAAAAAELRYVAVRSPMVGTFYRAPAPDAEPYVEVGQQVEIGQTVCIIEAMKLMNEIEADVRGRIAAVKVENHTPVEYGQVLYLVDPA